MWVISKRVRQFLGTKAIIWIPHDNSAFLGDLAIVFVVLVVLVALTVFAALVVLIVFVALIVFVVAVAAVAVAVAKSYRFPTKDRYEQRSLHRYCRDFF